MVDASSETHASTLAGPYPRRDVNMVSCWPSGNTSECERLVIGDYEAVAEAGWSMGHYDGETYAVCPAHRESVWDPREIELLHGTEKAVNEAIRSFARAAKVGVASLAEALDYEGDVPLSALLRLEHAWSAERLDVVAALLGVESLTAENARGEEFAVGSRVVYSYATLAGRKAVPIRLTGVVIGYTLDGHMKVNIDQRLRALNQVTCAMNHAWDALA